MNSNDFVLIEGTLAEDAQVRSKPMGEDATSMPVLCLVINTNGPNPLPVRAEQTYPPSHRAAAEKAAHAMRRGMQVSVKAPCAHIRTTLAHCESITLGAKAPRSNTQEAANG